MNEGAIEEFLKGLGFPSLALATGRSIQLELERSGEMTLLYSDDRILLGLARRGEVYQLPSPGKILAACHYRTTDGRDLRARVVDNQKICLSLVMNSADATSATLAETFDFLVERMDRLWAV